jgi:hypothetical protein
MELSVMLFFAQIMELFVILFFAQIMELSVILFFAPYFYFLVAGLIPDGVFENFQLTQFFWPHCVPGVELASNTNE